MLKLCSFVCIRNGGSLELLNSVLCFTLPNSIHFNHHILFRIQVWSILNRVIVLWVWVVCECVLKIILRLMQEFNISVYSNTKEGDGVNYDRMGISSRVYITLYKVPRGICFCLGFSLFLLFFFCVSATKIIKTNWNALDV